MKTYEMSFLRNSSYSNCWTFLIVTFADVGEHITFKYVWPKLQKLVTDLFFFL